MPLYKEHTKMPFCREHTPRLTLVSNTWNDNSGWAVIDSEVRNDNLGWVGTNPQTGLVWTKGFWGFVKEGLLTMVLSLQSNPISKGLLKGLSKDKPLHDTQDFSLFGRLIVHKTALHWEGGGY
eukprot:5584530-Amphidinium_carterae.1